MVRVTAMLEYMIQSGISDNIEVRSAEAHILLGSHLAAYGFGQLRSSRWYLLSGAINAALLAA